MAETPEQALRVALITGSGGLDHGLQQFLQQHGVQVVSEYTLEALQPEHIDTGNIDVLLVDLEDPLDAHLPRLDWLVGRSRVPILFNAARGAPRGDAGNSLIAKLAHLARNPTTARRVNVARMSSVPGSGAVATIPQLKPQLRVVAQTESRPADQVWVLAAALGGPQAVSRFLRALPEGLPLAFVYAQHIGADFTSVLARQMSQISSLDVLVAENGALLCNGQMVIVPAEKRFVVNEEGCIELQTLPDMTAYRPSIDSVMSEVARRYGAQAGAIVFSGMGDDGVQGVREIALLGGNVWAQDAQSCQISTMPDTARRQGVVSFSAAPELLAAHLVLELGEPESL